MFIHTHLHFQKHTIKRCLIPLACQLVSPVHIYAARRSSTTNYTYIKRERERDGRWSWKFLFGSAQCHKRPFDVGFPSNDNATAAAYYSRTASYTDKKKQTLSIWTLCERQAVIINDIVTRTEFSALISLLLLLSTKIGERLRFARLAITVVSNRRAESENKMSTTTETAKKYKYYMYGLCCMLYVVCMYMYI